MGLRPGFLAAGWASLAEPVGVTVSLAPLAAAASAAAMGAAAGVAGAAGGWAAAGVGSAVVDAAAG